MTPDLDGARTLVSRRFMPPQPSDSPFQLPSESQQPCAVTAGETAQETTAQAQPSSSHKQEQDHA